MPLLQSTDKPGGNCFSMLKEPSRDESELRPTGIEIIGDVPWGTHFCQFYQNERDLIDLLIPYFKAGLDNNEFCMWITSEPLKVEEAKNALARVVPNLNELIRTRQLEILDYREWYTLGGKFESDRVLRGWVEKLNDAKERGFSGLRLSGNTFWLEKSDWGSFTDYEAAVDRVIGQFPMLAMCTYSLEKCGAIEILDVVANHAFALIKRGKTWQIIEGQEKKKAEVAIRKSEERYRTLFEQMSEGFALHEIILDSKGEPCDYRFLDINPAFERLTGLKRENVVGRTVNEVLPENGPHWISMFGKVALTRQSVHFENHLSALERDYEVFSYSPAPLQFAALFLDVTERKRMEKELQENEERYRALVETSPDAIIMTRQGRFLFANAAALLLYGAENFDQLSAYNATELVPPQERAAGLERIGLAESGKPLPMRETRVSRLDGREVPVEVAAGPVRYQGEWAVQGVIRDISRRKQIEEKLAWLASFPEMNPNPVSEVDLDSKKLRYLNATGEKLFPGLSEKVLDHPWLTGLEELAKKLEVEENPFTHRDLPIGDSWYLQTIHRISGEKRCRVYGSDITALKKTQKELRETRDYLENLINFANAPIIVWNPEFKITRFNRAFERLTGLAVGAVLGKDLEILFPPDSLDNSMEQIRRTATGERWETVEIPIQYIDGSVCTVLWNSATLFKTDGTTPIATMAQGQDITERKRAEVALRETADELASSNRDLEQFAYVASHDLQEPLRAVTGFMGLLQKHFHDHLDSDVQEYISFAVDGAVRMQNLITDLLTYSRVGSRKEVFRPTDMQAVLETAIENLRTSIKETGASVTFESLPTITADPSQMTQLLQNLIGNAIKFRADRPPEVHVRGTHENGEWKFGVCDNGIGIETQYFDRIFLIFQKLHSRTKYPGTGIGLAICKRIVERHSGKIWVESAPEKGSAFYFTIPDEGAPQ